MYHRRMIFEVFTVLKIHSLVLYPVKQYSLLGV